MVKLISTDPAKHGISGDVLELLGVLRCAVWAVHCTVM
jgi:hypothetical protein